MGSHALASWLLLVVEGLREVEGLTLLVENQRGSNRAVGSGEEHSSPQAARGVWLPSQLLHQNLSLTPHLSQTSRSPSTLELSTAQSHHSCDPPRI